MESCYTLESSPFSSTISVRTVSQDSLSNLSMAEQMVLNLPAGTPQRFIIPSKSTRWFNFTVKRPKSSLTRISVRTCSQSKFSMGLIKVDAPLHGPPAFCICIERAFEAGGRQ